MINPVRERQKKEAGRDQTKVANVRRSIRTTTRREKSMKIRRVAWVEIEASMHLESLETSPGMFSQQISAARST